MDKQFLKECIRLEVYESYKKGKLSLLDKIWCRYFRPESNSVLLIRKYLYYAKKSGFINLFLSRIISVKLMRRYGIFVNKAADIGKGLRLIHPFGIFITNAQIGENLTLLQNCTIGSKDRNDGSTERNRCPHIGNNVTMYANSMIVGSVNVADEVVLASHAMLTKDANASGGVYIGCPAHEKGRK